MRPNQSKAIAKKTLAQWLKNHSFLEALVKLAEEEAQGFFNQEFEVTPAERRELRGALIYQLKRLVALLESQK
jgi:hypothetical protein